MKGAEPSSRLGVVAAANPGGADRSPGPPERRRPEYPSLPRAAHTRDAPVLTLVLPVAEAAPQGREGHGVPSAVAAIETARRDPQGGPGALSPVLDDAASATILRGWLVQSLLLEAITRDGTGDASAAEDALDRALDIAEHDRLLLPFLVHPVPVLLQRHRRRHTEHANLIVEIFGLLVGEQATSPPPPAAAPEPLPEPLTETEARVLRYLPTNLSKRGSPDVSVGNSPW